MNDLRVGICGCTRLYHGELEGKKWIISAFVSGLHRELPLTKS